MPFITARKYFCGKVMFSQALSVHDGMTSNASWDGSHGRVLPLESSGRVTPPAPGKVRCGTPDPLGIRPGNPLLVTSGGDHWKPVQTC